MYINKNKIKYFIFYYIFTIINKSNTETITFFYILLLNLRICFFIFIFFSWNKKKHCTREEKTFPSWSRGFVRNEREKTANLKECGWHLTNQLHKSADYSSKTNENNKAKIEMANKRLHILSSRSRSPILLFTICLFAFSLLFLLFSLSTRHPSASPYPNTNPNLSLKPETSFVASLEHFLNHKYPRSSSSPFPTVSEEDVSRFDDQVFSKERDRFHREPYYPLDLPVRVYVYEMPSKFTHDLLWLFRNTYRDTDNLTSNGSPVHRLIDSSSSSSE